MEVCIGMMGMAPSEFWDCSVSEVNAAIEGFTEFNSSGSDTTPMDRAELEELMELNPD